MNAIFYLVRFSFVIDVGWFLWMKHVFGGGGRVEGLYDRGRGSQF
jgi:hypothetical protein